MPRFSLFHRSEVWVLVAAVVFCSHEPVRGLTIDEAIRLARETLPSYKAAQIQVQSSDALYGASFSPYLPSLDAAASRRHELESLDDYLSRSYDVDLSYTLFDWGKRRADRSIAKLNLETQRETLRNTNIDLAFSVKVAFYNAMARYENLEQRGTQLRDATKIHEVAEGRYRLGVAKLSDMLQASVQLEQARFNLTEAEGSFRKSLVELNSLTGRPLDNPYDAEGGMEQEVTLPPWEALAEFASKRPEILQAQYSLGIAESSEQAVSSEFFPRFSFDVAYNRTELADIDTDAEDSKTAAVTATWNIFELGKFYRKRSSAYDVRAAEEEINELERQFLLDIRKSYEDVVTAMKKLTVAGRQLEEAEHNYEQAFGQYKVGKADILSVVQAETDLADARDQLTRAKLDLALSKALLEQRAGIERLEEPLTASSVHP